jgi:hypothetical protein
MRLLIAACGSFHARLDNGEHHVLPSMEPLGYSRKQGASSVISSLYDSNTRSNHYPVFYHLSRPYGDFLCAVDTTYCIPWHLIGRSHSALKCLPKQGERATLGHHFRER